MEKKIYDYSHFNLAFYCFAKENERGEDKEVSVATLANALFESNSFNLQNVSAEIQNRREKINVAVSTERIALKNASPGIPKILK